MKFPSREDRLAHHRRLTEAKGSFSGFTEEQLWRYHAYMVAFQRVLLGKNTNPLDLNGDWYDAGYAARAEDFYREIHRKPRLSFSDAVKPPEDVIRSNWYYIRASELTEAETVLSERHKAETLRRATAVERIVDEVGNPVELPDHSYRYEAARAARHKWAVAHGCVDFKEAMKIGLQAVGRR